MKRLYKYVVAAGLAVSVSLANAPEANTTGLPTIDISNLVQNIMNFMETQLREGSFFDMMGGAVTKLEEVQKNYTVITERLDDFRRIASAYKSFKTAYDDIDAIIELNKQIFNDAKGFNNVIFYFNQSASYNLYIDPTAFGKTFTSVAESLTQTVGSEMQNFTSLRQSDPMQLLNLLHELTEKMYTAYAEVRMAFQENLVESYDKMMTEKICDSNAWFATNHFI